MHGYKKWVMFPPDIDEEILFLISGSFLFPDRVLTQIEWFEHVYPRLNEWNITDWYEVDQGPGDLIYVPGGGWWHSVISYTDTASISYNMFHEYDYKISMDALCKRGKMQFKSTNACNVLKELNTTWYENSCCKEFHLHPENFPLMKGYHAQFVFPGFSSSIGPGTTSS